MPRILLVDEDAGAPPRSCAVETSCHRGRAPLRQTLAVAPRHPAALQRRSLDAPWHTPRAEIVRLRGVPINRDAGEPQAGDDSIIDHVARELVQPKRAPSAKEEPRQSPTTSTGLPVEEQVRKEWDPRKGGLP